MLKRKIFAVALPIIAGATIVGSGFAAWVFGTQTSAASGPKFGIEVTDSIDLKDVELKLWVTTRDDKLNQQTTELFTNQEFLVELDQGARREDPSIIENERGIRLKTKDGKVLEKIEAAIYCESDSLVNMKKAGFEVKLSTTITFNTTLLSYVNVKETNTWYKDGGNLTSSSNGVYESLNNTIQIGDSVTEHQNHEYYVQGSSSRLKINTNSAKDDQVTTTDYYHTNEILNWKKKPTSKKEVDDMRTALKDVTEGAKIEFTLGITDPNA